MLQFMMVISWIKLYRYKQSNNETVTVNGISSARPVPAAEALSGVSDALCKTLGCLRYRGGRLHPYAAGSQPPWGHPAVVASAAKESRMGSGSTADALAGKLVPKPKQATASTF